MSPKWDVDAADAAALDFNEKFQQLEYEYPEAIAKLRQLWKDYYLTAGHKRLARILVHGEV